MNLEYQVTSLELSKKLHDIGVKQESLFYWGKKIFPYEEWLIIQNNMAPLGYICLDIKCISSFTASELLELLPNNFTIGKEYKTLCILKHTREFFISYKNFKEGFYCRETDKNICNALAKMLIYLIENKLI